MVGVEVRFRRRLRRLVKEKYGSLDRFYLETDFSKGHLSNILRGKRKPSIATLARLAQLLDVEVRDLFDFPEAKAGASPYEGGRARAAGASRPIVSESESRPRERGRVEGRSAELAVLLQNGIQRLIERKYGSLERLCAETGFSNADLDEVLGGDGVVFLEALGRLARSLDVDVRDLFVSSRRGRRR